MEPAIPRPEQDKAVAGKLAALRKKTGKRPNIVWIVVDDTGYGDPGRYGGGAVIGAATPNIDRPAREGLKLTSCCAQHLHADALGAPHGAPPRSHRVDAADSRGRQDHQEPVGGRNQHREVALASEKLPKDVYIDGIDQTSFLLHDEGKSNRECMFFWWQSELMAVRIREYKAHFKVVVPQAPHMSIDLSTIQDVGPAPWLFNLYIDPKEEMTVGHRMNAWLASVSGDAKAHAATFKKYPPKDIGLKQ